MLVAFRTLEFLSLSVELVIIKEKTPLSGLQMKPTQRFQAAQENSDLFLFLSNTTTEQIKQHFHFPREIVSKQNLNWNENI
jgi:hypothetical protein